MLTLSLDHAGLPAGPELDALVAEKVMGYTKKVRASWTHCLCGRGESCDFCAFPIPYSASISAAWEVVEHLCQNRREVSDGDFALHHERGDGNGTPWVRWTAGFQFWGIDECSYRYEAKADTAPHAICLAAIRALGIEPNNAPATAQGDKEA